MPCDHIDAISGYHNLKLVSWIIFSKTEHLICCKTSFCQTSVMASSSQKKPWQKSGKSLSYSKLNVLFLRKLSNLHITKQNEKYPYNLKLDKKSLHLTTFACQFGRYKFMRLLFGLVPGGDMFEWKINEIIKDLPNVFGIAGDTVIAGYDTETCWGEC